MTTKSMALMLIIFSLVGLAIPSGAGVLLQTVAFAQTLEANGDAEDGQVVDNESTRNQDSSADDNVFENDNDFGDDIAAIGQDNTADQDTANLGLQEQEAEQEQEQEQDAANLNVDSDVQVGEQVEQPPPPPPTEPTPGPEPTPEEDTTPPTLTVPEDMVVEAPSAEGAQVRFTVTAEDNVDGTATLDENNRLIQDNIGGDITISCDPPSGSTFPIGSTEVEYTATD